MIQVLHRAFDILEKLDSERPLSLSEIAKHLKINDATCSHIVKTMTERGYVEQVGARKGYIIGPNLYYLGNKGQYRKDLTSVAIPLIHSLVDEIQEDVVLCTLRNYQKFILYKLFGNQEIQINQNCITGDIYQTATGRLLLANLKDNERKHFISIYGMPGSKWPSIRSKKQLYNELDNIRDNNFILNTDPENVVFIAMPVQDSGSNLTALGIAIPKMRFQEKYQKKVTRLLKETSTKITTELKKKYNI